MAEPLEIEGDGLTRGRAEPVQPVTDRMRVLTGPTTMAPFGFNEEEQEIVDLINTAHQKILKLNLRANKNELAHAVHTMQMYVLKHALQRIGFRGLSRWFWKD